MQQAPSIELGQEDAPSPSRVGKFLAAGVAVVGATAIAVTPVSPVLEDVTVSNRSFSLTASANPTYSSPTAAVYQNLFAQASANLSGLGDTLFSDPFPILSQVGENQLANADKIIGGFTAIPDSFNSYWNGNNGKKLFDEALVHLQNGEYADAWDRINRSFVYSLNVLSPVYAAIWSQAPSARNPEGNMGIPEQMATNLLQVVQAVFDRASIVNGSTQALLGPFLGLNFEIALLADAVTNAIEEGDAEGVFTALVNAPGVFANTFLNGYVNPECEGAACEDQFPGLINATGPIVNLFSGIPKAIAEALKPDPVPGAPFVPTPPAATPQIAAIDSIIAARNTVTLEIEPASEKSEDEQSTDVVTEPVADEVPVVETTPSETAPVETTPVETAPVVEADPVIDESEALLEEAGTGTTAPAAKRPVSAAVKKTQAALKQVRSDIRDSVSKVLKPRNKKDSSSESSKDSTDSGADKDTAKSDKGSDKSDNGSSKSGDE
ncbi:hypothetical protein [[Mycobacterium] burgundiense]|uniref:PE-PPE domain-containing protein n=1 Tax=[Mycobacterium] burgundiense TaxID=3064286 RepID=A0ABN9NS87_9MYCO|nr:hypothetical protein [Mycolicibacterium sp. MU0053]CAJ1509530.1 hypothetical protein MU0053_004215 [Mycolicibacterium sp. MU0053]